MSIKLIVALDFDEQASVLALVNELDPRLCALKVGSELFTRCGPELVRMLVSKGFKVFLDLKFHDIPHTVACACKAAADLGVWMLNVHALGGATMMNAAREAIAVYGASRPLLIAVTVLTSMDDAELAMLGIHESLETRVCNLAQLALKAGLDGVVSSALEVPAIKAVCGANFLTVTPGIRLMGDKQDDQSRICTPQQALAAGSDYLVMGRSITRAKHPPRFIRDLLSSF